MQLPQRSSNKESMLIDTPTLLKNTIHIDLEKYYNEFVSK